MRACAAIFFRRFADGGSCTGGRLPESLHERVNVSSPNTKTYAIAKDVLGDHVLNLFTPGEGMCQLV
jgi:hypothetical protein